MAFSCSKDDYFKGGFASYESPFASKEMAGDDGLVPSGVDPRQGNTQAGMITAGEWCDLANWDFWGGLMTGEEFSSMSERWGFYTNNRVAVEVVEPAGKPVCGVEVKLVRVGEDGALSDIWKTRTDNHGQANCWIGLYQRTDTVDNSTLAISLDGDLVDGAPVVSGWDAVQGAVVNRYTFRPRPVPDFTDICFIVDATGSMGDEMEFLKQDLQDIITRSKNKGSGGNIRTSAVFYRDEGDDYVTKKSDFTNDLSVTHDFVKEQKANGGGDYPEAVHTALEKAIQGLSWKEDAYCKLAFMLLDAPAHYTKEGVLDSLHKSVELFAQNGIKLIPIAASGVDKDTEFMLRFFSAVTGGTYVFITNDSGIGGDHIAASVGEFKVEQLNDLIVRLIQYYMEK